MRRRAAGCAFFTLLALPACSTEPPPEVKVPEHGPVRPHGGTEPYIFPEVGYTGSDGTVPMKLPFTTNLEGDVTWTVENPLLAQIYDTNPPQRYAEFGETWAMVETFAPGTTRVTASAGGKTVSAMLVISDYDPAVVYAGRQRYYDMTEPGGTREACYTCHGSVQGADHSPLEMEVFTDDEILEAIVDGKYSGYDYVLQGVDHRWDLTDAERAGIVPFLRTLAPNFI